MNLRMLCAATVKVALLLILVLSVSIAYATPPTPVQELVPRVLSTRPHDPDAFTQGLLLHDGVFYESAGRYGQSSLREVDPDTGEVLRMVRLPDRYFAEGLALVDDRLIQLTWQEGVAFVYDRETFGLVGAYSYTGEGWGLCYDGEALYMSDGSATLFKRDPETFELTGEITVRLSGEPVERLNELECVDEFVYANVWKTDLILRIDKATGRVSAVVDASGLLDAEEAPPAGSGGVLNGIAYDPEREVFLITGKLWPRLFEVEFVPRPKVP